MSKDHQNVRGARESGEVLRSGTSTPIVAAEEDNDITSLDFGLYAGPNGPLKKLNVMEFIARARAM